MFAPLFVLTKATHFFKISEIIDPRITKICLEFTRQFIKVNTPRGKQKNDSKELIIFASGTRNRTEFRFHINTLEKFHSLLQNRQISDNLFKVVEKPHLIQPEIGLKVKEGWKLREDQLPVNEYIIKPDGPPSRFVGMQTGDGKTFVTLRSITKRTVIIVRPMFMDKWVGDVHNILDLDVSQHVVAIRGMEDIKALLELATIPGGMDDIKVIIFSNKTMQLWFKQYVEFGKEILEQGFKCLPEDFYDHCGIGCRVIDEVHMDFHLNFLIDLYSNVEKSISLSATLLHGDSFIEDMQKIAYPMNARYKNIALKRYAISYGVTYYMRFGRKYKTTEFNQTTYSHNAFEKSIMKNPEFLESYMQMIKDLIDKGYIAYRKPGQRAIVFASSIAMCTALTNYLKESYPDLDVRRYVEDDPYTNYLEPDIRVTTIQSGGTAHDVKNLIAGFLTVGLQSLQTNIQVLGRLRLIEGVDVRFYFFSCLDIPKHIAYHRQKEEIMRERAAAYYHLPYQRPV